MGIKGLLHLKYPKTDKLRKQVKLCEVCFQNLRGRSKCDIL